MNGPWEVGLALALAIVIGYSSLLVVRLVLDRRRGAATAAPVAGPPVAGKLLRRAEVAVARLREQTRSPKDPMLRSQISDVDDQAAAVLADLRRSAEQVTSIERSLRDIPVDRLRKEHAAAQQATGRASDGPLRAELEHAERSLAQQLAVARRLDTTRRTVLARIEAAVLDLEGLSLRVAELIVMHDTMGEDVGTADRLTELTGEVESMRAGLAEARQLSSGMLDDAVPPAVDPTPAPAPAPPSALVPAEPVEPAAGGNPRAKRPAGRGRPRWDIVTGVVAVVLIGTCLFNAYVPHGRLGSTADRATGCTDTIAFLGPLSGDNDGDGLTEFDAVTLAVEQYDAGAPRCRVVLRKFDTADDGAKAAATDILADPDVLGVVGPTYRQEAFDALPALDAAGVPVISPSASDTVLTTSGWKVFHRTLPSDDDQADAAARYLRTIIKAQKVFVVGDDSDFGQDAAARVAERLGTPAADRATVAFDQKDFTTVVKQITASKADAVYFGGLASDGGALVKRLHAANAAIKVIGGDRMITTGFFDAAGDAATGVMATCPCAPTTIGVTTAAAAAFQTRFKARFGDDPTFYSPEAYDAAQLLLSGIKAGHRSRAGLLAWADAYDFDGISRHLKFGPGGGLAVPHLNIWLYTVTATAYTPTIVISEPS